MQRWVVAEGKAKFRSWLSDWSIAQLRRYFAPKTEPTYDSETGV